MPINEKADYSKYIVQYISVLTLFPNYLGLTSWNVFWKITHLENLLHGMKMDNFDYSSDSLIPNLLDL